MLIRLGFFAALVLAGAVFMGARPSEAQAPSCSSADLVCRVGQLESRVPAAGASAAACQPADLACRVTQLEARVTALEGAQHAAATAPTAAPAAAAPRVVYVSPTELVSGRRACRSDCRAEAAEFCTAHGFSGGEPEDWDRPRSGPVMMTRARCNRAQ